MQNRPEISAVIITKNEEDRIERCLKSVDFCEEFIVLDSLSDDKTCELAKNLGAKVSIHPFDNHINQKNRALALASKPWVISLDADEQLSPKLREVLTTGSLSWDKVDGFSFPRLSRYLNRWIYGCGWYPDRKIRLFRKEKGRWAGQNPHDFIKLDGKLQNLEQNFYHYPFRNMHDHFKTLVKYGAIASLEIFNKRKPFRITDTTLRPIFTFIRDYFLRLGFRDGRAGFIICCFNSFSVFYKYLRLYERYREERGKHFHVSEDS